ncbi:glycogen/starch/alpha-glucan phosphorylase [Ahrensia sp. R2A130]|uniref:glycogen/starch/alpha-glucan phosphorylase n=1 Tax=Ahrensia sp. R2A130 TaxID=744979 RepID=UPI00058F3196|nr:glycogen/starch/alpha-glucan phosphorylase [Ahrensia sp. R2A130]
MPSLDAAQLQDEVLRHLHLSLATDEANASDRDWRLALSLAIRDQAVKPWLESESRAKESGAKRVYYLSMEFLMGRLIEDLITNLRIEDAARNAMAALGQDYDSLVKREPDAALGNGGLGRLAACFLDSLSTLGIPAFGYGIRYEHGLFEQSFEDGRQMEEAETWLKAGDVWEIERPERQISIGFGGKVKEISGKTTWIPAESVLAVTHDTPVVGWEGNWTNTLRLWAARPVTPFDLDAFNKGKYKKAAKAEMDARNISRVLYPDDTTDIGKELRLKQEFFFTAASLRDLLQRHLDEGNDLTSLPNHVAIQLNDTHPAVAGPELVRLLADEHGMAMDEAITTARACLAYTNHTLLPEALERWSVKLFGKLLPRHLQIVKIVEKSHADSTGSKIKIIEDKHVKMGELAVIMAHKVNGVSALHSELVKENLFTDLHATYPDRLVNQTNGITPRRWLYECNPQLRTLINDTIGTAWPADLEQLKGLEAHADDDAFIARFAEAKAANKQRMAEWIKHRDGITIDPAMMFDIQIKRLHEYKRQLMNLLETVALWNDISDNPTANWTPRLKVFGGKAAPGYVVAKEIIHLINDVAVKLNADPKTRDMLQVLYPANYNVTMAEMMIPATDLSEQISTAGKEASGTGNMKFALNGAMTIGTLDGANVEIREHVGAENFYLFGLTAAEVEERRKVKDFAQKAIDASPRLTRVVEQIEAGVFSPGDKDRYTSLMERLRTDDYFLVTCDFDDYFNVQRTVDADYRNSRDWTRKTILNTARMGWFSSDRTIAGYAKDIWNARSLTKG